MNEGKKWVRGLGQILEVRGSSERNDRTEQNRTNCTALPIIPGTVWVRCVYILHKHDTPGTHLALPWHSGTPLPFPFHSPSLLPFSSTSLHSPSHTINLFITPSTSPLSLSISPLPHYTLPSPQSHLSYTCSTPPPPLPLPSFPFPFSPTC